MVSESRKAAYTALYRCFKSGAWSSKMLDGCISDFNLDKRDGALASRLCIGVLQNFYLLDYYIDHFSGGKKLQSEVRIVLRMGAYQILFNDRIPAHASVNESVELCKATGAARAAGLVNAVLRKLNSSLPDLPEIPGEGTSEYLSIKYSHPVWMVNRLIKELGYEDTESFLIADNIEPLTDIQINTNLISAEDYAALLKAQNIEYEAGEIQNSFSIAHASIAALPGFEDGYFFVQDSAANFAVRMAEPVPGIKVLDCCSAPGGKSFAAAILMQNEGSILSCDIHEKKLRLIKESAERMKLDIISTRSMDASEYIPELDGQFDLVIADVPCSGIGVIAKKSEIRLKKEEDIKSLPDIQKKIISNVCRYVKISGRLLYSTCTVFKEENENIINHFLEEHKNFRLITGRKFIPGRDNTDGFFAAVLERTE